MNIRIYLLAALLGLLSFSASAHYTTLVSALSHPESILSDGQYWYVSDIGKAMDPLAKDGDGSIRQFTGQGEPRADNMAHFPLHAPKGMALARGVLYVADIDRVVGIDLATGNKVAEIDFSAFQTTFLNDLVAKNDSSLFVSASDLHQIFHIALGKNPHIEALNLPVLPGANGLCYDRASDRLYVAGLGSLSASEGQGEIGYVSWKGSLVQYTRLLQKKGFYDGIALINANTLVVSDWQAMGKKAGILSKIDLRTCIASELIPGEKLNGPADFYFDQAHNQLLIPEMLEGKILVYRF